MIMENNLENKARFFAQYWGQFVLKMPNNNDLLKCFDWVNYDSCYLELKSLEDITDDDMIGLGNVLGIRRSVRDNVKDYIDYHKYGDSIEQPELDYLRSKGYALPWMGLSVEKLIKYGWVKLKKADNETK
ncbi:hypothetical protein CMU19_04405 [Elizabethkingia anophelis]|nr:hypothetical protein [Elizabethkingia anophelis]